MTETENQKLHKERLETLEHLQALLEKPMTLLAFAWLVIIILRMTGDHSITLFHIGMVIWLLFIINFLLQLLIAPHKADYLRVNWLTAISLLLPALGVFRIFGFMQVFLTADSGGYVSLLSLITGFNRGLRALRNTLSHRGIGYAASLAVMVLLVGSAGMMVFESPQALHQAGFSKAETANGLPNYGDALWFTAMLMTTIGSSYSPFTVPGRILCWILSITSISIAGYLTASIASYFVGQDQKQAQSGDSNADSSAKT